MSLRAVSQIMMTFRLRRGNLKTMSLCMDVRITLNCHSREGGNPENKIWKDKFNI
jgi:hypothetical protein